MTEALNKEVWPYLFFDGRCEEALEFYKKTVGAQVGMMMRFDENPEGTAHVAPGTDKKIMHAAFRIGGSLIMASDGYAKGQPKFEGFALSINAKDDADAKKIFEALSGGGKITQPLIKTFFSSSFGMLTDKFGVHWMVIVPQGTP